MTKNKPIPAPAESQVERTDMELFLFDLRQLLFVVGREYPDVALPVQSWVDKFTDRAAPPPEAPVGDMVIHYHEPFTCEEVNCDGFGGDTQDGGEMESRACAYIEKVYTTSEDWYGLETKHFVEFTESETTPLTAEIAEMKTRIEDAEDLINRVYGYDVLTDESHRMMAAYLDKYPDPKADAERLSANPMEDNDGQ